MMRATRRARRIETAADGRAPWMITFTDLLFLLLTFLVMRFAMLAQTGGADAPREGGIAAASDQVLALQRALESELGEIFDGAPVRNGARTDYSNGATIERSGDELSLAIAPSLLGDDPTALPFQTATILRSATRVASTRGYGLAVRVNVAETRSDRPVGGNLAPILKEESLGNQEGVPSERPADAGIAANASWRTDEARLGEVIRQIVDTGVGLQSLAAGFSIRSKECGSDCQSGIGSIDVRFQRVAG